MYVGWWSGQVIKGMVEREKGTLLFTGATASIRGGAGFSEIGKLGAFVLFLQCEDVRVLWTQANHLTAYPGCLLTQSYHAYQSYCIHLA